MDSTCVSLYHVTVLSNFARAFDKYQGAYRKAAIPESTYPGVFHMLPEDQLAIGIAKATRLRDQLAIPGDALLVLCAVLPQDQLQPNRRNGIGVVWPSSDLPLTSLHGLGPEGRLSERISFEEVMAQSLALHKSRFIPYSEVQPRSISFLPIAKGCQAACPFCFSEASVSAEQKQTRRHWDAIQRWVDAASDRGAQRAVITGGGEPTLMPWADLLRLIRTCRTRFDKVVLISNGVKLAALDDAGTLACLSDVHASGLSVLAVSRHHASEAVNTELMKISTHTPRLLQAWTHHKSLLPNLKIRLVCVLQQGGVESVEDIDAYVAWAASWNVDEVCFKELYVSTSEESIYYSHRANEWSAEHQVPLSHVHRWAQSKGFRIQSRLPWGAPIYDVMVQGHAMRVAAYTEPSLFWERSNGVARSWNVMADGTCLASLEDRHSAMAPSIIATQAPANHDPFI